jgi:hypothetical protein
MNTLVLRNRLDGDPSFAGALTRVRELAYRRGISDLPFEHVLRRSRTIGP